MADKHRDGFPVLPIFSAGEQLNPAKLSSWAAQTDRGINQLEYAIGDIHAKSWPYFSTLPDNTPIGYWAYTRIGGALSGTLAQRHEQITNIGRSIGPMSALSPRILPSITNKTLTNWLMPSNGTDFYLPFAPETVSDTHPAFTDTTTFANRQTSPEDINAIGDYYVGADGRVVVQRAVGINGSSRAVTYDINVSYANASDAYPGATLNVIPDPNQTTRCTVTSIGSGEYRLAFPTITQQQADRNEQTVTLGDPSIGKLDLNYGETPTLPAYFATHYAAGAQILEGLVYVWDNTANSIVDGCVYEYDTQTSIIVIPPSTSPLVVGTDRYSVIVNGTDLARTIDHLRWRHYIHAHVPGDGSQPISHSSLAGNIVGPVVTILGTDYSVPMVQSVQNGVDHPQYLTRRGYDPDVDGGEDDSTQGPNWGGAMVGNIRFGSRNWLASSAQVVGTTLAQQVSSYGVEFITGKASLRWRSQTLTGSVFPGATNALQLKSDEDPLNTGNQYLFYGDQDETDNVHHLHWGNIYVLEKSGGWPFQGEVQAEGGMRSGVPTGDALTSSVALKWWSGTGTLDLSGAGDYISLAFGGKVDLAAFTIASYDLMIGSIGAASTAWYHAELLRPLGYEFDDSFIEGLDQISIVNPGSSWTNDTPYRLTIWYY